jgi:carbonic anhydrase/acetyltransferase-like protein (isoleucine patch superfamily)
MALIKSVRGFTPKMGKECFLADNATLIGDVVLGDKCSIWFNTVVRGDVNSIRIGNRVNIQDGSVLHCLYQKSVIEIGDDVSIGHNVIVHGARIEDHVLIGMGAIIMDNAVIGRNSIIAAGALVLDNTNVPPGSIYAGLPARRVKSVEPGQTQEMIEKIANNYIMYSKWYDPGSP